MRSSAACSRCCACRSDEHRLIGSFSEPAAHAATGLDLFNRLQQTPLDQITAENFGDLEVRWHWESVDSHLVHSTPAGDSLVAADTLFDILQAEEPDLWTSWDGVRQTRARPSIRSLVATPLMVDGVLYLSTPLYRAVAIDARTGKTLWAHDPRAYESGMPAVAQWRHRGVAYWENDGDARIVWATGDGFLIAVDVKTGLPAPDFGDNGRVDLTDGVPRATRGSTPCPRAATSSVRTPGSTSRGATAAIPTSGR